MAFAPRFRMGPPPRSFAADAHDCIVVAIPPGRPNTSSWRATRARWRAPLGIVAVVDTEQAGTRHARVARLSKSVAVLATVKGKSLRDGLRPPLTATARSAERKPGRDEPSVPMTMRQTPPWSLPLRAEVTSSHGHAAHPLRKDSCRWLRNRGRP